MSIEPSVVFDPKYIGKMKMAELEDAIKLYEDNIEEVKVVELVNNNERAAFLEGLVQEYGVAMYTTDKDGNQTITFATVSTQDAQEALLAQLEELTAAMPEAEQTTYLAEAAKLDTDALSELVNKLVADAKKPKTDPEEEKTDERDEDTDKDNLNELEANEDVLESDDFADRLTNTIEAGALRYEGRLMTGFRPKPVAGVVMYELYGSDNATYLATKEQLEELI